MDLSAWMPELIALGQVLLIDLVLAGDNAIVVGMAAAGLPADQRRKAIFWGIAAATIMRIGFAAITTQLLAIVGLTLAGGILLLWVCYKMFRELQRGHQPEMTEAELAAQAPGERKTLKGAIIQILVADVSMSLDNVLAVAGAAKEHLWVLVVGLGISVILMGVAATFIARLLERHRWIAWVGLLVILYVAVQMMWTGGGEVLPYLTGTPATPPAAPAPVR
jgi:YjbE family integral membrane protein